mgnify:CR=1 FL=1
MKLETTRFGTIDIEEKKIIEFSEGLYGFEKERRFTFLPFNPNVESPMEWMQSILSPHLAFVITDPYLYVPDYKLKLLEEDKKKPYTDDKLAEILKNKGYPIARRTIAKYREQLEVPVARLRKKI